MSGKAMTVCEMRDEAQGREIWRTITIDEALRLDRRSPMRCIECHGAVEPRRPWRDPRSRGHFEHVVSHLGCPLGHFFSGRPSLNPLPLE